MLSRIRSNDVDALYSLTQLKNDIDNYRDAVVDFSISGKFREIDLTEWQQWFLEFKDVIQNSNIVLKTLYFFSSGYDTADYATTIMPFLDGINCTYISFPHYHFLEIRDYILDLQNDMNKIRPNVLKKLVYGNGFTLLYYLCCMEIKMSSDIIRNFIEINYSNQDLMSSTKFNVFYKGYINYLLYFVKAHTDYQTYKKFYNFFTTKVLTPKEVYLGYYYAGSFHECGNSPDLNFLKNPYSKKNLSIHPLINFIVNFQEKENIKNEMKLKKFTWALQNHYQRVKAVLAYYKKMKKHLEKYPNSLVKNFVESFDQNNPNHY